MRDLADFVDDVGEAKVQMERVLLEYRAGIYTVDVPSRRVWQMDDLVLALVDEVLRLRRDSNRRDAEDAEVFEEVMSIE